MDTLGRSHMNKLGDIAVAILVVTSRITIGDMVVAIRLVVTSRITIGDMVVARIVVTSGNIIRMWSEVIIWE